eukprot:1147119-Amphidinium_carterae.1
MSTVEHFQIFMNRFQGTLPESGLHAARALLGLRASSNCFAGSLPDRELSRRKLAVLYVDDNYFEGHMSQTQGYLFALFWLKMSLCTTQGLFRGCEGVIIFFAKAYH